MDRVRGFKVTLNGTRFSLTTMNEARFEDADVNDAYFQGATLDESALRSIALGARNWAHAHFDTVHAERLRAITASRE
ncbi:pentapeptide repeat-containing protein [Cryobacterium sp. CG_9.6]|uniref:pentapeptide repeat-containing protein n=1 Tax=Cryobacterium sp. CG_9.6 TaxID=2760710 RepID=UPI002472F5F2|nr:pentapeptide repeat-containing protein [Cryobacterium sp. CG_9.6]MDH6238164.1 uncharacterized protein YjbI with pentapeptide repeats [Cryobacterium sp. CG_9.6]